MMDNYVGKEVHKPIYSKFRLISTAVLHEICWYKWQWYEAIVNHLLHCENTMLLITKKQFVALAFFLKLHKFVNIFIGTPCVDNIDLLNAKAHFLHYNKAWKTLGIFDSGEASIREIKERQQSQYKFCTLTFPA